MTRLASILFLLMIAACLPPKDMPQRPPDPTANWDRYGKWTAHCNHDEIAGDVECIAGIDVKCAGGCNPFKVVLFSPYVNGKLIQPFIRVYPGHNPSVYPDPIVRVDNNQPIRDMKDPALIEQMLVGEAVKYRTHSQYGNKDGSFSLRGFPEAYSRAMELIQAEIAKNPPAPEEPPKLSDL